MSHAEIINQKLMALLFEFFKFPDNHIRLQKDILFCNFNPEHVGIYPFLFHSLPDISLNVPQQGMRGNVYGNFKDVVRIRKFAFSDVDVGFAAAWHGRQRAGALAA